MKMRSFAGVFLCVATIASAAEPKLLEVHAVVAVANDHTREYTKTTGDHVPEKVMLDDSVLLDQTSVKAASVAPRGADGSPRINIELTEKGRVIWGDVSTKYVDKRIGIVLVGQLQCAPVIREPMFGGSLQIIGNFTEAEARQLVQKINQSVSP